MRTDTFIGRVHAPSGLGALSTLSAIAWLGSVFLAATLNASAATCGPRTFAISPATPLIERRQPATLTAVYTVWTWSSFKDRCMPQGTAEPSTWSASGGKLVVNPSAAVATFSAGSLGLYSVKAVYASYSATAGVEVQLANETVLSQMACPSVGCDEVPTGKLVADKAGALYATAALVRRVRP